jgi:DNA-binding NarL/FixJ family response regulator
MNTPPQNLVNAIKTVYNGGVYIYKEFIQELLRNSLNNAKKNDLILEHLTHKEEEVLNLLCEGLSNKKIAKILGMSEKTVKSHLTNIYSKLNVKSRLEAVIIAHRLLKR